jgi:hypothetical protein
MKEKENLGLDDRTILMNKAIGILMVVAGIYGLYNAYKLYSSK